jgi:hypothetical protein
MTQKLFCLCAVGALLFAFATVNVASAQEAVAPAGCPCGVSHVAPCPMPCGYNPCYPPTAYRVGLFGVIRPVYYAPVYRPVYAAPRYYYAPYRAVCPPVACPPCAW